MKFNLIQALALLLALSVVFGVWFFWGGDGSPDEGEILLSSIPDHESLIDLGKNVEKVQDLATFIPALEVYSDTVNDASKFLIESQKQGFIQNIPICSLDTDDISDAQEKWEEAKKYTLSLTEKFVKLLDKKMQSIGSLTPEELAILQEKVKGITKLQLRVGRSTTKLSTASERMDKSLEVISKSFSYCSLVEDL